MELKKLECPSCGAPLEWNTNSCNFCKTELRYLENNSAILPKNLTISDIEDNIVKNEEDFWNETLKSHSSSFYQYKNQNFKNAVQIKNAVVRSKDLIEIFKLLYTTYFIIPSESFISCIKFSKYFDYFIFTSLRLFIIRDNTISAIPWSKVKSWKQKAFKGDKEMDGWDGRYYSGCPILIYFDGEQDTEMSFNPADDWIDPILLSSIKSSHEWEYLNPLQRNLLLLTRNTLTKAYKLDIKPLTLMEFKSGNCFVATATMGDYNHPIVIQLQDFRDTYLSNKTWGKSFVKWYYKNGPYLASFIDKSYLLKKMSYWFLIRPLFLISKFVKHF